MVINSLLAHESRMNRAVVYLESGSHHKVSRKRRVVAPATEEEEMRDWNMRQTNWHSYKKKAG
jgi:hypothetical protein